MIVRFPLAACLWFWIWAPVALGLDFAHDIVPLLRRHCGECHTGDKKKGGFSLNTRELLLEGSENGSVVVPGQASRSRLIEVLRTTDVDEQMPPKGPRLDAAEIALLQRWVEAGLPWEPGFAFQQPAYEPPLAPRQPELPPAVAGRDHPVDRILDADLRQRGQPLPPPADDATFLRRVSLDLIGLLPSAEAAEAFLSDRSSDKRARKIRELLTQDVAYAEHWLTFWNDLLRNDYGGTGFITGGRKQISQWLYEALVTNKPADRMARELIAPAGEESRGFIDGIRWRGEVSAGQTVEVQFAQSVAQSFLGINLKCASCHDSFIDRWKLDQAYALAAVYANRPLEIARCDKPTGRMAQAGWLFPELGRIDPQAAQPERLKQLAALMTHPQNGRFQGTLVNRLWHRLMGRGIVHPVDAMQTEPWSADLLDYLASELTRQRYDLKQVLATIATSAAYQSQSEVLRANQDEQGYRYAGPRARRLTAEQFVDAIWQLTGTAPPQMDAPVLRGKADPELTKRVTLQGQWIWGPSAKDGAVPPAGETMLMRRTLQLPEAPNSAVAVITCDNGYELFVNGRRVSQGNNWQQLEAVPLQTALRAGDNVIAVIARNEGQAANPAGLWFEVHWRDATGREQRLVSDRQWECHPQAPTSKEGRLGALPKGGWQPVEVVRPVTVWTAVLQAKAPALLAAVASGPQPMVRASLMKADLLMRSLGRPNRDQIVSMRPNELTTLEAMDLANGALLADILARGARQLSTRPWSSPSALVRWLYLATLCREPTASEQAASLEVLGAALTEPGIADLLWAVTMLPEFQQVR